MTACPPITTAKTRGAIFSFHGGCERYRFCQDLDQKLGEEGWNETLRREDGGGEDADWVGEDMDRCFHSSLVLLNFHSYFHACLVDSAVR